MKIFRIFFTFNFLDLIFNLLKIDRNVSIKCFLSWKTFFLYQINLILYLKLIIFQLFMLMRSKWMAIWTNPWSIITVKMFISTIVLVLDLNSNWLFVCGYIQLSFIHLKQRKSFKFTLNSLIAREKLLSIVSIIDKIEEKTLLYHPNNQ